MSDSAELIKVYETLVAQERQTARDLLRTLVKTQPSADAFYYSALTASTLTQANKFLDLALKADPFHTPANRLHFRLEKEGFGALDNEKPAPPKGQAKREAETTPTIDETTLQAKRRRNQRNDEGRRRFYRWLPLYVFIGASSSVALTYTLLLLLGVGASFTARISQAFGADVPQDTYRGTPIALIQNPASLSDFPASASETIGRGAANTVSNVLADGDLHEYGFQANAGEEIAVAIQFFSPFANEVVGHLALLDPSGRDRAFSQGCEYQSIIDASTGAGFLCIIDQSGEWKLRVYGREGRSSGVYVITVDQLAF
ncbi:MAG: hypothetical protein ACOYL5_05965 [Phototrophicaceae bacterium]|jgi:hypothetical protein